MPRGYKPAELTRVRAQKVGNFLGHMDRAGVWDSCTSAPSRSRRLGFKSRLFGVDRPAHVPPPHALHRNRAGERR